MVENKGGSVCESANQENIAAVEKVEVTQAGEDNATWVVVMKEAPRIKNFTRGMKLTYNAKGTSNTNADNYLTVTSVNGPAKYTCSGNWPINI